MGKSRRIQNLNGAAHSYLKVASKKDGAASQFGTAVKSAPKAQQQLVQNVLNAVRAAITDSDVYQLDLDSRTSDVILGRIASLLDEVKDSFVETELAEAKEEILEEIRGLSLESILKNFLLSQIAELFDSDAKKEDVEELRDFLQEKIAESEISLKETVQQKSEEILEEIKGAKQEDKKSEEGAEGPLLPEPAEQQPAEEQSSQTFKDKAVDSTKDEANGPYKDSTIAANFTTLQNYVQKQVDLLNKNIAAIPGGFGIGAIGKAISAGVVTMLSAVGKLGSKIASFAKKSLAGIANVSKFLVGGAFKGIFKALGAIKSGIGSVVGLVGKVGSGIVSGFKSLGSGIKSIGSKVGGAILHPFKAIGGFFSRRKKNKEAEKKEKLREKFMNFVMGMVDKIWTFVEPILMKLKIFMLVSLIPILTTAVTVLAIIAAVTLLIVGIVLAVMWVKNKLFPKIKALWTAAKAKLKEWWTITKAWFVGLWEGFKEGLAAIWDGIIYIVSFKWLVEFGEWIWKKLVQFGEWLYKQFIYPYVVEPFVKVRDKLAKLLEPVMKKLQPFIESAQNLFARLKSIWQNFKWDESKSFFENMKSLGSIIIDAVKSWWETSPFKAAYDTYVAPILQSLSDLVTRVKAIWAGFSWDENKSFVGNLMSFWDNIKAAIQDWWKGSPIKTYWDKLVDYLTNLAQKVTTWFKGTKVGGWIMSLQPKIEQVKEKMAAMSFKIPTISIGKFDFNWKHPIDSFSNMMHAFQIGSKEVHPFGFLKGTPADGNVKLEAATGNLTGEEPASMQLPAQQVQNALAPVNSLNSMNADSNLELQKTGEEMSSKAAAAEQATAEYRQQQSLIGSQSLSRFDDLEKKLDKYGSDPAVVPMPIPYGPQRNAAMMENY